jgi:hypothetical protein
MAIGNVGLDGEYQRRGAECLGSHRVTDPYPIKEAL